ncbi:MAG: PaaI family thioesterase [Sandaracinaceae bacterium]|nr:PaaI family thioesterase [Sandaracinaceae bacterium]MBK7154220.1 PaaI family thioesterase [Sandaracinaceae bacterium]MBK7776367.1 PaaI family thioesterase [Sandaracinaceae bacterium]MBK8409189.1 PaaI family thioesterase [Sandaracinaceae bacterium]MBK8592998.1 PaaI family thioesterase [Sandaracinaceae bacterium]
MTSEAPPHRLPPEGVDLHFPFDTGCVGCSPTNPIGLRLVFRREGNSITGEYQPAEHFRGGPGAVHGGILALMLDEYSCAAGFFLTGRIFVTGSLNIRYERPTHMGLPLTVRAQIMDATHPKYSVIDASVSHLGTLLATSTGRFFPVDAPSSVSSPA